MFSGQLDIEMVNWFLEKSKIIFLKVNGQTDAGQNAER